MSRIFPTVSRIRGLWRFDGDEEPVQVSRRAFLFMGASAAAQALLGPRLIVSLIEPTLSGFKILRCAGIERGLVGYGLLGGEAALSGEWLFHHDAFKSFEAFATAQRAEEVSALKKARRSWADEPQ